MATKTTTFRSFANYLSEWEVFRMLDNLQPTAAGLDGLPAWYLQVAAPIFCKTISITSTCRLLHPQCLGSGRKPGFVRCLKYQRQSDTQTVALSQLHQSCPVQIDGASRRSHVRVSQPPNTLTFSYQFAFRPTGSISAAIIFLLRTVTDFLQSNEYDLRHHGLCDV